MKARHVLVLPWVAIFATSAQATMPQAIALADLSLEQLSDIEVTSVSKSTQSLRSAAAAVAILTSDEIQRSGATTVPEALRLIPGLHVAQQHSSAWAVSARGFSSVNSEKLLVLSDTRSIYTPLFSGVIWDVQNYVMDDIERIEVIRGPGATLWGSNAVNGVINITTKNAYATQGSYIAGTVGTEDRAEVAVRHGDTTDAGVAFRVYAKYFDRGSTSNRFSSSEDDWRMGHVGFRSDWDWSARDEWTLQGDLYRGTVGRISPSVNIIGRDGPSGGLDTEVDGGNILGRWRHRASDRENFVWRVYFDRTHRDDPSFRDDLDTFDVDFQHQYIFAAHELLWGINHRITDNRNRGKGIFNVDHESSQDTLTSLFLQDQITLSPTVQLTVGTKYEHNDFSGDEWQPSVRLSWDFHPRHTLWSAVSRAVRVPTRLERDIAIDVFDPPANPMLRLSGNDDFESEELIAYELGYRWQARDNLALDVATFYNDYEKLASLEIGQPFIDFDGTTIIPILNQNLTEGRTSGVEVLIDYVPLRNWRLTANYSYIDIQLDPQGADINRGRFLEGATPRHQFGLRSMLDFSGGIRFDLQYRYVSAIRHLPEIVSGDGIAGYSELDMRLAKRLSPQLELSLIGKNLLHDRHPEFGTPQARGEIERSVSAKVVWQF